MRTDIKIIEVREYPSSRWGINWIENGELRALTVDFAFVEDAQAYIERHLRG